MNHSASLRHVDKDQLLRELSELVREDQRNTARTLAYIAEVDRRKLYLEHAYPSMFAFCTNRFHMSEAIAVERSGTHQLENIQLRCRAHNQYEAEVEYGVGFMERQRAG